MTTSEVAADSVHGLRLSVFAPALGEAMVLQPPTAGVIEPGAMPQ
eukprot:gene11949-14113_t